MNKLILILNIVMSLEQVPCQRSYMYLALENSIWIMQIAFSQQEAKNKPPPTFSYACTWKIGSTVRHLLTFNIFQHLQNYVHVLWVIILPFSGQMVLMSLQHVLFVWQPVLQSHDPLLVATVQLLLVQHSTYPADWHGPTKPVHLTPASWSVLQSAAVL